MNKIKHKFTLLALLLILLSGFGIKGCVPEDVEQAMKPVVLDYWRVWDGPDAFSEIISAYANLHPHVTINYRKLRYSEYENELLHALAEDREPDIISIHNTWVRKYKDKIEPMPTQTTMAYPVIKGALKKETVHELRTTKSISPKDIKNNFLDTVYDDVVIDDQIFGLPLSVDTLVMFYNKDLFNNAGIINPPEYWNKTFQQNIKQLTKLDTNGNIIQSGVALGGSSNIERSTDILSVLMMQNGANMMQGNAITFHNVPPGYDTSPGLQALRFYTDFASPIKEVYSWNNSLENSIDMFVNGKLAMMFGYAYHLPTIRAKGPKLNFNIVPLPQIEGNLKKVNYANYWVETILKKSSPENKNVGWDFIQFATRAQNVTSYLDKTKKPTALRSLIEKQLEDDAISVFADQLLTAESWYKGKDSNFAEESMKEMIDEVVARPENIGGAMGAAVGKIQQTIQ